MKRNNYGFTIIELLAAIVLLGILMGIGIPIVMSVLQDQRNGTYVEDAIRLASKMDYEMRSDNKMPIPSYNSCLIMSLAYLDDNTFNNAPYEGEYDPEASFVVAKRNEGIVENEYTYYVRLIEKTKAGSFRGVDLINSDNLYEEDARDKYVSNLGESNVWTLMDYTGMGYGFNTKLQSEYGITCSSIHYYVREVEA